MIFLDTDHLSVLAFPADRRQPGLQQKIYASPDKEFAITIVNVEEPLRGWLADIHGATTIRQQIRAYDRLANLLAFLVQWDIVKLDDRAADVFEDLRRQRIRIGTQDLKIASIALANDALLLSANLRHFRKVPGLRVENWLE